MFFSTSPSPPSPGPACDHIWSGTDAGLLVLVSHQPGYSSMGFPNPIFAGAKIGVKSFGSIMTWEVWGFTRSPWSPSPPQNPWAHGPMGPLKSGFGKILPSWWKTPSVRLEPGPRTPIFTPMPGSNMLKMVDQMTQRRMVWLVGSSHVHTKPSLPINYPMVI